MYCIFYKLNKKLKYDLYFNIPKFNQHSMSNLFDELYKYIRYDNIIPNFDIQKHIKFIDNVLDNDFVDACGILELSQYNNIAMVTGYPFLYNNSITPHHDHHKIFINKTTCITQYGFWRYAILHELHHILNYDVITRYKSNYDDTIIKQQEHIADKQSIELIQCELCFKDILSALLPHIKQCRSRDGYLSYFEIEKCSIASCGKLCKYHEFNKNSSFK